MTDNLGTDDSAILAGLLYLSMCWQVIGEHESSVKRALQEFGVYLKPSAYGQDVKPLLKEACSSIFGSATGLVDMMVAHFPSSKAGSEAKARLMLPS